MAKFIRPNKSKLRNPQHYEFHNAFRTALTDSGMTAPKIVAKMTEHGTAFDNENRHYMIARASEIIARREAADIRRDALYIRLHRLIQVWDGSGEPTKDAAAKLLRKDFDLYKVQTKAQLEVESGQMSNLITDLLPADRQAAITALGAEDLFNEMKAAHELVQSLRLEEGLEQSEKAGGAQAKARKECDRIYDELTYMIEAFALTADDPAPYEAFITRWNGTLKIYQEMLDRKQGSSGSSGDSSASGGEGGSGSGGSGASGDSGSGSGSGSGASGDSGSGSGSGSGDSGSGSGSGSGDSGSGSGSGTGDSGSGGDNGGGGYDYSGDGME